MRANLKNKTAFGAKMEKMNSDVYELRKNVLAVVYEAKAKGYDIPRIEVRIVSDIEGRCIGYAYMSKRIVHIDAKQATKVDDHLRHLVLHELLHAINGVEHDDNDYLMNPVVPEKPNIEKAWKAFGKYVTQGVK